MAAVLQTGVNLGIMLASLANFVLLSAGASVRSLFLVGVVPAFLVLWIRRAVPEPEEWCLAKQSGTTAEPRFADLFGGDIIKTTLLTLVVCALSLSGHWAFQFWYLQHLRNLPELADWTDVAKGTLVSNMVWVVMLSSIVGNFVAAAIARFIGYRRTITLMCLVYFVAMFFTYVQPLGYRSLAIGFAAIGLSSGLFALFTMYLPPLFPTLLRSTGAGFCYNFGRIAAGFGTVFFGFFSSDGDYRSALFAAGFLFLPAAIFAWMLPEPPDEPTNGSSPDRRSNFPYSVGITD